jgi:hypothetical protein
VIFITAVAIKLQQAVNKRYTQNPRAYDAYLRGSTLVDSFDQRESLETARKNFEQALLLDPNYPKKRCLAWKAHFR